MAEHTPDPEGRAKRGRFEIRTVVAIVVAVVVGGAIYAAIFGSPNTENRLRDDPNRGPGFSVPADNGQRR